MSNSEFYEIEGPEELYNRKFSIKTREYKIRWKNLEKSPNIEKTIEEAFQEVVNKALQDIHPQDRVGVGISHPDTYLPINISFTTSEKVTAKMITDAIEEDQEGQKGLSLNKGFIIKFTIVLMPEKYRKKEK